MRLCGDCRSCISLDAKRDGEYIANLQGILLAESDEELAVPLSNVTIVLIHITGSQRLCLAAHINLVGTCPVCLGRAFEPFAHCAPLMDPSLSLKRFPLLST